MLEINGQYINPAHIEFIKDDVFVAKKVIVRHVSGYVNRLTEITAKELNARIEAYEKGLFPDAQ